MKTKLPGNFFPSSLMRSMCFILFITASGCASTSKPITPSETTDAPDTFAIAPVKEEERDLYVPVPRKTITPSEATDTLDTFAIVPFKEGERDLYVAVSKGDHVLVYTKDDRKLDIVLTEVDSQKQTITGTGTVFYKHNNSWGSSPAYEFGIDVSFSEIEGIEIKDPEDYPPIPIDDVHAQPIEFTGAGYEPTNKWERFEKVWTWKNFGDALIAGFCGPFCW